MTLTNKIYKLLSIIFIGIFIPLTSSFADNAGSCSMSCDQALKSCKPKLTSTIIRGGTHDGDKIMAGSSSTLMDINCLKRNSNNSCFNQVPVDGGTGNYNSIGKRAENRNHYGTDIGSSGRTNTHAYPVDVGSIILYTNKATGSGNTLVINHVKGCQSSQNKSYHSVYRHLYKVFKQSGEVGKNTQLGIVGGSNVAYGKKCNIKGKFCQNEAQDKSTGCPRGGTTGCGYYDIHLHLEVADGKFSASGTAAHTSTILEPYCENISALCGDCPVGTKRCTCSNQKKCGGGWSSPGNTSSGTNGNTDRGDPGDDTYTGTDGSVDGGYSETPDENMADTAENENKNCKEKFKSGEYFNTKNCIFCNLFRTLFNAASATAKLANDSLQEPSKKIVSIGFLIWLCVYILKQIANFGGASTGEMLKGILFQGFRVALVLLILSNAIYAVMDLTLNPVMQTGLTFVKNLSTQTTCDYSADYMQNILGYDKEKGYNGGNVEGGLSKDLGKSIVCSIKSLEDSTGFMMGLGKYSVCLAFDDYSWLRGIVPEFTYAITGVMLWLAGLFVILMFPWCLIDCILQICIAAALIPCAIAAFAFKSTARYIGIVWNFFMNAMFNFVFLGIIVYVINSHLKDWIGMNMDNWAEFDHHAFFRGVGENSLAWWGMGFIKVAAICFFCNTFFEEASDMAKKFADAPGLGGSKGIGRMVGGTMAGMAGALGKNAGHAAAKVGRAGIDAVDDIAGGSIRSGINHAKGFTFGRLMPKGQAIKDENGNVVGYQRNVRFMGRDISRTFTKDEDGIWTSEKTVHKRSATDKAFEKVYDENGDVLKDENGNDVYRMRHRVLGITTGYEDMTATKDENGMLIYTAVNGGGSFAMDADGNITEYKTRFSYDLDNFSRTKAATQNGYTRTYNDAFTHTSETLDVNGNITASSTQLNTTSLNNLINKDGTINTYTFNDIKNNTQNSETAAIAMVSAVMQNRGQRFDDSFKKRTQKINDDGSITIQQTNNDGSTQLIHAQMVDDQMVIRNTTTDKNGNITVVKSNGMQTITENYTRHVDKETGKVAYTYQSRFSFSDYLHQKNSHREPLNARGEWGYNLDPKKVMAGFTQNDFDKHLAQIKLQQMRKIMGETDFNAALQDKNSDAYKLKSMLHSGDIDAQNRLQQLQRKMGTDKFNQALQDPKSEVYKLNEQIFMAGLSEAAARIHAGQAVDGGLDVQLTLVDLLIEDREKTLKDMRENKIQSTAKMQKALETEINNLALAQKDIRKALGIEENS